MDWLSIQLRDLGPSILRNFLVLFILWFILTYSPYFPSGSWGLNLWNFVSYFIFNTLLSLYLYILDHFHNIIIQLFHHYQHHQCHYPSYLNGSLWLKIFLYIPIYLRITETCGVGQAYLTGADKTHLKISEIICCSKWKKTSDPDVLLQAFPTASQKVGSIPSPFPKQGVI